MSQYIARWTYLTQVIVQRVTLVSILSLAVTGAVWSLAAAVGLAPWLRLDVGLGGISADAGPALQFAVTLLLLGLSLISEEAVQRARFIRTALEVQTCRTACETLTESGLEALASIIEAQKAAVDGRDREKFHALDDRFHREICVRSGVGYVWELIHDSKAHMDRIRMLSLNASSQRQAFDEHINIFTAISARDPDRATEAITKHLSRILVLIEEVKALDHTWFTDVAE